MFHLPGAAGSATALAGLLCAAALAAWLLGSPAARADSPPSPATVTSAFTPSTIPVQGTSALSITITNPNASATLSGISFTDALPSGVVVDNPNGASGTCGSSTGLTAAPGSATVSLSGGTLKGGASCTVSVAVTSTTPGAYKNTTGPVSATETSVATSGDTQTLQVIANPTVTVSSPREHQTFAFGQKVKAAFSCAEAAGGPGLSACSGDVDNGQRIDTIDPGPQTFTVTAVSNDGAVVVDTIDYTVLPDNRVTVSHVNVHKGGTVTLTVAVPGAGKLSLTGTAAHVTFAKASRRPAGSGTVHVTLKPTHAGTSLLKRLSAVGAKGFVAAKLAVTFTPKGGKPGKRAVRGLKLPY